MNQEGIISVLNFLIHTFGWFMFIYLIEKNRPKNKSVLFGKHWLVNNLIYIAAAVLVSIQISLK